MSSKRGRRRQRKAATARDWELNFPANAQRLFTDLCDDESWSWDGLAMALVGQWGLPDMEDFLFLLGERVNERRAQEGGRGG